MDFNFFIVSLILLVSYTLAKNIYFLSVIYHTELDYIRTSNNGSKIRSNIPVDSNSQFFALCLIMGLGWSKKSSIKNNPTLFNSYNSL